MVIENITDIALIENLISRVSTLTSIFQAIGGLIIAYIIFAVVNLIINRKKSDELRRIKQLLEQINKKLKK